MGRVEVPDLDEKFRLLRARALDPSPAALAKALGVSPKTLRWWVRGDETRAPNQLPADKLSALASLFAAHLPDHEMGLVERLVVGPVRPLREAITAHDAPLLLRIIQRDAVRGQASVVLRSSELALVETDEPISAPVPTLRTGEWFRIEFHAMRRLPYALALQNAGQSWGVVKAERSSGDRWRVPGQRPDGSPIYMRERDQRGLHRFVCLQASEPFPAPLAEHAADQIALDKRSLEALAVFYDQRPQSQRLCQLVELRIEDEGAA